MKPKLSFKRKQQGRVHLDGDKRVHVIHRDYRLIYQYTTGLTMDGKCLVVSSNNEQGPFLYSVPLTHSLIGANAIV